MSEPVLKGVIADSLKARLEAVHATECWGTFERGFIYKRDCEACADRAEREPEAIEALELSLRSEAAKRCPQNMIARIGNPCRPECVPSPDDQNKGCAAASENPSDLEMDLKAAAITAEFAPKGVSVVLLADALKVARTKPRRDEEGELLPLILPPEAQFIATGVDGSVSVHVGIDNDGFTLGGDRNALRSLANMILHALDEDCPQCRAEVAAIPVAYMDEKGVVRTAATIDRYPTMRESFTTPLYKAVSAQAEPEKL